MRLRTNINIKSEIPCDVVLAVLQAQQSQDCFMQALEAQRRDALAALEAATAKAIAERRPLQRRGAASAALARAPVVKMYNPRFEEDFAAGRDYDPDRCGVGALGQLGQGSGF